ncbi:PASTA domain-containing protein [Streptomyces sp. MUM 136J]|nr:PASTA domain-containing protein [Streptomyces sp. MUM 136J]
MTLRAIRTLILVCILALSGCDRASRVSVVRAVASGVPSLAPFFDENDGLGRDAGVRARPAPGGTLQQGDTPGLYGGSRQPTVCDVDRLERFLTDPAQRRKAQVWAAVLGIRTDEISEYLDRLTPVLLRHDTLVRNHDYKQERAVPFDSLLQAGIAVLVDRQGLPAVKCSCGNPLRPFNGDTGRISVRFTDGNRKWRDYDPSSVVAVRPAPRRLERLALVDVDDPDRGIERPVGSTGGDDAAFDTQQPHAVPDVTGATFSQAGRSLTRAGLAVAWTGREPPPDSARVTGSRPPAGTALRFGEYVTLNVARPDDTAVFPPPAGPRPSEPDTGSPGPPDPDTGGPGSPGPGSGPPSEGSPGPAPSSDSPSPSPAPPTAPSRSSAPSPGPPPTFTAPLPTFTARPPTGEPPAPGPSSPDRPPERTVTDDPPRGTGSAPPRGGSGPGRTGSTPGSGSGPAKPSPDATGAARAAVSAGPAPRP